MNKNWLWVWKYVVVIVAALILGGVLGSLGLFKSATLGTPKVTAAALSQFIAQGGALALLWMLGAGIAQQLRETGGGAARLASMVLALVTLVVAASAYVVLLRFIAPFLARDLKPFLDWAFILGILAAAVWLLWSLYKDSDALIEALGKAAANRKKTPDAA